MSRNVVPWLFILPILLLHFFIVGFSSVSAFYYSLTEWSGIKKPKFIGLENYVNLFNDLDYYNAFINNIIWLIFFLIVPFILALYVASILSKVKKFSITYRTLLFLPYVLPSVVVSFLWRNLLNPKSGIFENAYLGMSETALITIAFIDCWRFWGFLLILFITAMQSIPKDLYESAKIDGANAFQEFIHVTLPGIRPVVAFMIMMVSIWSFLAFDYIWILTQGGPAGSSDVMATSLFRDAFARFDAGYAAAKGMTLTFIAGCIVAIFFVLRKIGWEI